MAKKTKGKQITVRRSGSGSGDYSMYFEYGTNGNDTITFLSKTKYVKVEGGKGNDIINVKGNYHKILGDNKGESYYYSTYSGKDTITLVSGKGHYVWGNKGNDKIYVKKGAGFDVLCGCEGHDTITVYKGARAGKKNDYADIDGGKGNDKISVTNGKYYDIDGAEGHDTITVTGGSYYKIYDKNGRNKITVKKAENFEVHNYSKGSSITIAGGKNGHIITEDTTVTINSGTGHQVTAERGKVEIKGGTNLTVSDSDWRSTNETIEIKGGSGTVTLEDGGKKDAVTIDFANGKNKVGNWEISADCLANNRLTVLGASSKEFEVTRFYDSFGPSLMLTDCWIMKNIKTGATITLEGWDSGWTTTFDIYFAKDNITKTSKPALTEVEIHGV